MLQAICLIPGTEVWKVLSAPSLRLSNVEDETFVGIAMHLVCAAFESCEDEQSCAVHNANKALRHLFGYLQDPLPRTKVNQLFQSFLAQFAFMTGNIEMLLKVSSLGCPVDDRFFEWLLSNYLPGYFERRRYQEGLAFPDAKVQQA